MNTYRKGLRAEREARLPFEKAGYDVRKSRMSKSAWDFVAHPTDRSWHEYLTLPGQWATEMPPRGKSCIWYVQVKSNLKYPGRLLKVLLDSPAPGTATIKLLIVRYDGCGRRRVRWKYWWVK